jgi:hypothetical protein
MIKSLIRILLALLGVGWLLLAGRAWTQADMFAAELGLPLSGDLGRSTFVADIGAFFAVAGAFMLLAALKADRQLLLPSLGLVGLALAGRLAIAGQTGFLPEYMQPMTVETLTVAVMLVAYATFRKA